MEPEETSPAKVLDDILVAARLQQAISVTASLGVPDALADGPRNVADIARAVGAHEGALHRLLGTLAAAGVLVEEPERWFGLTPVGELLRSDVPGSRRDWAILNGKPYVREAWSNLEHSIRTGENAFEALHGESVWSWRASRTEEQAAFDRTMASNSRAVARAVADAFDFAALRTIVDIGGGTGTLLAAILTRYPSVRGMVFDQPGIAGSEATRELLARTGVGDRATIVEGDFFEAVPSGVGGYLMKSILHDWTDEDCVRILRTIRAAASPSSRLLVIELLIGAPNEGLATRVSDLQMLVMPGGRERTEAQWRSLFADGGFALEELRPTASPYWIVVGTPA